MIFFQLDHILHMQYDQMIQALLDGWTMGEVYAVRKNQIIFPLENGQVRAYSFSGNCFFNPKLNEEFHRKVKQVRNLTEQDPERFLLQVESDEEELCRFLLLLIRRAHELKPFADRHMTGVLLTKLNKRLAKRKIQIILDYEEYSMATFLYRGEVVSLEKVFYILRRMVPSAGTSRIAKSVTKPEPPKEKPEDFQVCSEGEMIEEQQEVSVEENNKDGQEYSEEEEIDKKSVVSVEDNVREIQINAEEENVREKAEAAIEENANEMRINAEEENVVEKVEAATEEYVEEIPISRENTTEEDATEEDTTGENNTEEKTEVVTDECTNDMQTNIENSEELPFEKDRIPKNVRELFEHTLGGAKPGSEVYHAVAFTMGEIMYFRDMPDCAVYFYQLCDIDRIVDEEDFYERLGHCYLDNKMGQFSASLKLMYKAKLNEAFREKNKDKLAKCGFSEQELETYRARCIRVGRTKYEKPDL